MARFLVKGDNRINVYERKWPKGQPGYQAARELQRYRFPQRNKTSANITHRPAFCPLRNTRDTTARQPRGHVKAPPESSLPHRETDDGGVLAGRAAAVARKSRTAGILRSDTRLCKEKVSRTNDLPVEADLRALKSRSGAFPQLYPGLWQAREVGFEEILIIGLIRCSQSDTDNDILLLLALLLFCW